MRKITVLLADDHMIVRQGLKHLLQTSPDIEVVGEAATGLAAVVEAKRLQPTVVVLDIAMPGKNGIDAAREIGKQAASTGVLILSTYHEDEEVQQAIAAGAKGYMMKQSAGAELLTAIREIAKGNAFFSPPIARRMLRHTRSMYQTKAATAPLTHKLTPRELEVLKLIADGRMNKMIASDLGISIKTVEKHRQAVMEKLHIHEPATLTRYAISRGVVPCVRPSLVPSETMMIPPAVLPMS